MTDALAINRKVAAFLLAADDPDLQLAGGILRDRPPIQLLQELGLEGHRGRSPVLTDSDERRNRALFALVDQVDVPPDQLPAELARLMREYEQRRWSRDRLRVERGEPCPYRPESVDEALFRLFEARPGALSRRWIAELLRRRAR